MTATAAWSIIASGEAGGPGAGPFPSKPAAERSPGQAAKTGETVQVRSVRVTRDPQFRFAPGHYARVGIAGDTAPTIFRPRSIASAADALHLELSGALISCGEFSTRPADLGVGDSLEVERASFDFLTRNGLAPGTDLRQLSSGTGRAPFMSILGDAVAWHACGQIMVVHSVRRAAELAITDAPRHLTEGQPGAAASARLQYLPIVTRAQGAPTRSDRTPALLVDRRLVREAGVSLDANRSCVLVCGNPAMTRALRGLLGSRRCSTTRRRVSGQAAYW